MPAPESERPSTRPTGPRKTHLSQVGNAAAERYLSHPTRAQPALDGTFETGELAEGMHLTRVDLRDFQGGATKGKLTPGLCIAIVVGGTSDLSYGRKRVVLGTKGAAVRQGSLVMLREDEPSLRQSQRGDRERRISLCLSLAWLETRTGLDLKNTSPGSGTLQTFLQRHLSTLIWPVSAQAVAMVEQMLTPPALAPGLWRMYQESRALDLVVEAMSQISARSLGGGVSLAHAMHACTGPLRERDRLRMADVRELLDSGDADELSLQDIARYACLSVNTLQRHFRLTWGQTVFDYLRDVRLMRARIALERESVTVGEASALAGYTSAANFATAFRRHFGISPGQVRMRT